jgi:hypothetical protein
VVVIGLERGQHLGRVVHEIQDVGGLLAGVGAIQARQGLDGLNAGKAFVHVHAAKQWLVESGLKFVRDEQDLVVLGPLNASRMSRPLRLGFRSWRCFRDSIGHRTPGHSPHRRRRRWYRACNRRCP